MRFTQIIIGIIAVVVAIGSAAIIYQFQSAGQPKPELDDFAKCVTAEGWTMYGAYSCGHCLNEKRNYGSAFQYINYVECTEQARLCTEKEISGYPTWLGPNGEHWEGEMGLQKMSEFSGCPLPAGH